MNLTSYLQDKQLTIALTGEIDHHRAKEMIAVVAKKIEEYVPMTCVLDFSGVSFMDSSGIAVVISALRRMRALEGRLLLDRIPDQPMRVLRAAGIEKVVEIRERSTI